MEAIAPYLIIALTRSPDVITAVGEEIKSFTGINGKVELTKQLAIKAGISVSLDDDDDDAVMAYLEN